MITLFRCVDQHNEQKYLIETWMLSLRYEEEIEIVKNEMTAFLRSTRKKICDLQGKEKQFKLEIIKKMLSSSIEQVNFVIIIKANLINKITYILKTSYRVLVT